MVVAATDTDAGLIQQEGVGPPRKYLPRKKIPANLRSLARGHTEMALRTLAGIAQHGESEAARVTASIHLLDRVSPSVLISLCCRTAPVGHVDIATIGFENHRRVAVE